MSIYKGAEVGEANFKWIYEKVRVDVEKGHIQGEINNHREHHFNHRFGIYRIYYTRLLVLLDTMGIVPYSGSICHLIWTLLNSSRRYCTLKSQLLLDNFYLFLPQFQIKTAHFSLVFPTYVQLCTQFIVICLEPFQKPTYLVHLKNSAQMLSSSMFTVFQVTNNWSPSMMDKSFKLHQKKVSVMNYHQNIELLFDQYT